MLQSIRDKAQGWIAWAIVILITIPFALWGIQEYLGVGGEPVVAKVAGQEITQRDLDRRARDFRESLRIQLGSAYKPDLISEDVLRTQVRERMIDERVLLNAANDWGLRAGDSMVVSMIHGISAFQRDGRFDVGLYDTVLRNQGMPRPMFENSVRQDLVMNQLRAAVGDSALVTQRQLADAARLQFQTRKLAYLVIPNAMFEDGVEIKEDALATYYEQQRQQFQVPEKVSIQYLLLDVAALAKQVKVDDAALQAYFAQHAAEFRAPEERRVRHILVAVPAGADDAAAGAALAKAQALRQRIEHGEDFAAVAHEASDDPGSADKGGDLGWIEPGMMAEAFETAAYGQAAHVVSEPVRTQFGYHLIEVTDIRGSGTADFEQVRDKVAAAYQRHEAEARFYDMAERLADLTFENPGSLAPAAETLGLDIQTTGLFSRDDPPAVLSVPKAVAAAFSHDVLEQGNNSEIIELATERVLVLRVLEHEPEHLPPLAEVRDKVVASYRAAQAAEAAAAAGESALQELNTGKSLQDIAAAKSEWRLEQLDFVGRDATEVPGPVVDKAFALPAPAPEGRSLGGIRLPTGYALVEVQEVRDGDLAKLDATQRGALENRLRNAASRGDFANLLADIRARTDVEIVAKP